MPKPKDGPLIDWDEDSWHNDLVNHMIDQMDLVTEQAKSHKIHPAELTGTLLVTVAALHYNFSRTLMHPDHFQDYLDETVAQYPEIMKNFIRDCVEDERI